MKTIVKVFKCISSFVLGYLLVPNLLLGFILATNSSKGWNVANEDGKLFIPLGIIILAVSLFAIGAYIFCLVTAIINKNFSRYLFFGFYALGIIIYLIQAFCF